MIPGFYAATVLIAVIVALAVQGQVIAREHLKIDHALAFSLIAIAFGLVGAKVWYITVHRREGRLEGWCIQGVIAGIGLATMASSAIFRLPVGTFLDASAPGLFFAMAIGRVGCFFGGCCAGRPTASPWGLWSSLDQRLGMRRIPAQLIELLLAFAVGLATLFVVSSYGPMGGAIFVGGMAAYTLGRQGALRLRSEGRKSALGSPITAAAAALVFAAALLISRSVPPIHSW